MRNKRAEYFRLLTRPAVFIVVPSILFVVLSPLSQHRHQLFGCDAFFWRVSFED